MAEQDAAPTPAGLLEQPPSWLQQLVISLPAESRSALFQTCMQLAMQVLASAPNVLLRMRSQACVLPQDARRSIISRLLTTRKSFLLVVQARAAQPFPMALSSKVAELWLQYTEVGPVISWLDWSAFTNVKSLHLTHYITQPDLDMLCDVLEAGYLSHVGQLRWEMYRGCRPKGAPNIDDLKYERLARALGSRITSLFLNNPHLLRYLQHLTALRSIEMTAASRPDNSEQIDKLMNHSTLRSVTLLKWDTAEPEMCQTPCNWRTLHLVEVQSSALLLELPIANLTKLCIHKSLQVGRRRNGLSALQSVVRSHLDKVSLVPEWDYSQSQRYFKVVGLTVDTISIVSRLKFDCCLHVWLYNDSGGIYNESPAILPALWAALPNFVSSVRLLLDRDTHWPNLWDGIPHNVKRLELYSSYWDFQVRSLAIRTPEAVCNLVAHTPEHVDSLTLCGVDSTVQAAWTAAGVYMAAPKFEAGDHVQVDVVCVLY